MGPIWDPYGGPLGPYGAPWAPWAMADGPWPMGQGRWAKADMGLEDPGLEDPPWGYISGPEADGAPWAPWASGTPPWGYHLIGHYSCRFFGPKDPPGPRNAQRPHDTGPGIRGKQSKSIQEPKGRRRAIRIPFNIKSRSASSQAYPENKSVGRVLNFRRSRSAAPGFSWPGAVYKYLAMP